MPPPALSAGPITWQATNTLRLSGLGPAREVWVALSRTRGPGPCAPAGTPCLALDGPERFVGPQPVVGGTADVDVFLQGPPSGGWFYQVVARDSQQRLRLSPVLALLEEDCTTDWDEDGNGFGKCRDPACVGHPACAEDCANGRDDDRDGREDCEDSECRGTPLCLEDCATGVDEDLDRYAGCDDDDCASLPSCQEDCSTAGDSDGNGVVAAADPACQPGPAEICDAVGDEDRDGRIDCEDGDCSGHPACVEQDCTDGVDGDDDGLVDCEDDDCWGQGCGGVRPRVLGGTFSEVVDVFRQSPTSSTRSFSAGLNGVVSEIGSTGTVVTCTWTTRVGSSYAYFFTVGTTVEPGCPIGADPVPPLVRDGRTFSAVGHRGPAWADERLTFARRRNQINSSIQSTTLTYGLSLYEPTVSPPFPYRWNAGRSVDIESTVRGSFEPGGAVIVGP
jgi:hypothetical protein